jgi:hypothetical protein
VAEPANVARSLALLIRGFLYYWIKYANRY